MIIKQDSCQYFMKCSISFKIIEIPNGLFHLDSSKCRYTLSLSKKKEAFISKKNTIVEEISPVYYSR